MAWVQARTVIKTMSKFLGNQYPGKKGGKIWYWLAWSNEEKIPELEKKSLRTTFNVLQAGLCNLRHPSSAKDWLLCLRDWKLLVWRNKIPVFEYIHVQTLCENAILVDLDVFSSENSSGIFISFFSLAWACSDLLSLAHWGLLHIWCGGL